MSLRPRGTKPKPPPQTDRLASALLDWFARHARDLPWRRTRDPYAIWISEIMLQQTQVKTVVPYWQRWMRALPDVQKLARAKPERVLKLWEGLGYYTRARNLHQAARIVVANHGAKLPESFDEVLALPGVGRYTAGAICSIAFNQPAPVLDGNVIRVLTRLFGIRASPKENRTKARLWNLAQALVHAASSQLPRRGPFASMGNCSSLNQCLMELGAVICTPRQPKCERCPLRSVCVARRGGCQEALPNPGKRTGTSHHRVAAFVIEHRGRFLVRQRPEGVVNARLWEFPNVELTDQAGSLSAAQRLGLKRKSSRPFFVVNHSITRHRIRLEAFRGKITPGANRPQGFVVPALAGSRRTGCLKAGLQTAGSWKGRWLTLAQLEALAFTAAHRRILQQLKAEPPPS